MRAVLVLWSALSLLPSLGYAQAQAKDVRVLLLELRTTGVDRESVLGLVPLIASEAAKPPFHLITSVDVVTVLGVEKQKQLIGCTDTSCFQEIGGALDAKYLISPEVSAVGGIHMLSFVVLDGAKGTPVARVTRLVPKEKGAGGLVEVTAGAITEVLEPIRAKTLGGSTVEKKAGSAPAAATEQKKAAAPAGTGTLRKAGYAADGIGAAGLVAAVICDALAVADHGAAKRILRGEQAGGQAAFEGVYADYKTKRTAAGALYVGGAVILAAGLVMTLLPEATAEAPKVGFGVAPDGSSFVSIHGVWR